VKYISGVDCVHNGDARDIRSLISPEAIDVTITSPPYFDMKDYGYDGQIGYGQSYEDYLNDIKNVFDGVYRCTKESGTLWVIIDTLRKGGEVVPLPFDFDRKMREVGWKLREIIIWEKDKTVPWVHKGQVRNCFEYVLMFSKSDEYNFYVDNVRSCENIKKWWVKYPERYNPSGKAPRGVWNFPIPTQGSWGNGYVKHFCPLPDDLIGKILRLSSVEGDVVLDPFSGSGAVLAKAYSMKRRFVGIEMNREYISMFERYLDREGGVKRREYEFIEGKGGDREFYDAIMKLRVLKFARMLYKKIPSCFAKNINMIRAEFANRECVQKNALAAACYKVLFFGLSHDKGLLQDMLNDVASKPPLSKFGIEPEIVVVDDMRDIAQGGEDVFLYTKNDTSRFSRSLLGGDLSSLKSAGVIVSSICVAYSETDYE
jgi:DNA modification methylase